MNLFIGATFLVEYYQISQGKCNIFHYCIDAYQVFKLIHKFNVPLLIKYIRAFQSTFQFELKERVREKVIKKTTYLVTQMILGMNRCLFSLQVFLICLINRKRNILIRLFFYFPLFLVELYWSHWPFFSYSFIVGDSFCIFQHNNKESFLFNFCFVSVTNEFKYESRMIFFFRSNSFKHMSPNINYFWQSYQLTSSLHEMK